MEAITKKKSCCKPRILVCSTGGMQAGDLAAFLIRDFEVELVMTMPALILAVEQSVQALIIFMDNSPFCQSILPTVDNQLNRWHTRVMVFGSGKIHQLPTGYKNVRCYAEIPTCQIIMEALEGLTPIEKEAH